MKRGILKIFEFFFLCMMLIIFGCGTSGKSVKKSPDLFASMAEAMNRLKQEREVLEKKAKYLKNEEDNLANKERGFINSLSQSELKSYVNFKEAVKTGDQASVTFAYRELVNLFNQDSASSPPIKAVQFNKLLKEFIRISELQSAFAKEVGIYNAHCAQQEQMISNLIKLEQFRQQAKTDLEQRQAYRAAINAANSNFLAQKRYEADRDFQQQQQWYQLNNSLMYIGNVIQNNRNRY